MGSAKHGAGPLELSGLEAEVLALGVRTDAGSGGQDTAREEGAQGSGRQLPPGALAGLPQRHEALLLAEEAMLLLRLLPDSRLPPRASGLASRTGPEEPLCPRKTRWPHPRPWEAAAQEPHLPPSHIHPPPPPSQRAETQAREGGPHSGTQWEAQGSFCSTEPRASSLPEAVGQDGDARGSLSPRGLGVERPVGGDTVVPTSLTPVGADGRGLSWPEGRGPRSATVVARATFAVHRVLARFGGCGYEGRCLSHPLGYRELRLAKGLPWLPLWQHGQLCDWPGVLHRPRLDRSCLHGQRPRAVPSET